MHTDSGFTSARILVVEDQDDVRLMLVTALEIEGYAVDGAGNALEGLRRLKASRYDLILTDYAMPGGTGTWMLHEAARLGLADGSRALIITAHPDVRELADVEVITKPLDVDSFLDQVRRLLEGANDQPGLAGAAVEQRPVSTHKVDIVLYINSASPSSVLAQTNLERMLSHFEAAQVKITIVDLVQDPLAGEADKIASTPTLVMHCPEPKMWVLGGLRDTEILEEVLRACGVGESR
ncbi:MAG TPA: response regulator [Vicinamibacterales bacterium]|nr:response regulator [Vicinamibacterales bacterium]